MVWNGSPILISAGPIAIRWYGAIVVAGFMIGAKFVRQIFERERWPTEGVDRLAGLIAIGAIVGARLGHTLIYEPERYLADPVRILKIWEGGLASHGGTVGAILGIWWWARKNRPGDFWRVVDVLSIVSGFVSACIRLGNFFNSEIVGKPTDVPWAIVFARVDQYPRHPAMLYESLAYLSIFGILMFLYRRWGLKNPGFYFGAFLALVYTARFFIEFVKEVQVATEAGWALDFGQLLSIPFILAGVGIAAWAKSRGNA